MSSDIREEKEKPAPFSEENYVPLGKEHFARILDKVFSQVFEGKGEQRHGLGIPFEQQPWRHIVDNVGPSFTVGQSLKKLMELRSINTLEAYEREILGAIAYLVMSLMYVEENKDSYFPK